jgi:acyl-CoA-binding protein
VEGSRPGFTDMVGRAKWDAWNALKGQSADEAKQSYIDLIESLK